MKKDIVFFGIQGAGKTVQALEIMKQYTGEYEHLSPGLLGREMSQMDNML
jgi:adenylate kinase family enzyme